MSTSSALIINISVQMCTSTGCVEESGIRGLRGLSAVRAAMEGSNLASVCANLRMIWRVGATCSHSVKGEPVDPENATPKPALNVR